MRAKLAWFDKDQPLIRQVKTGVYIHSHSSIGRVGRKCQLLFMPPYNGSLVARCYQTFLDAIRDYPNHSDGACHWDQRTFHPDRDGSVQPLSLLWSRIPGFLDAVLNYARLAETTHLLSTLRICGGRPAASMPNISGQEEGAR